MRNAHFGLWLVCLALGGCLSRPPAIAQPPRQTHLSGDRVELPATFIGGQPFVDLRVNGNGPYRFIIDTGAEGTSILPQVAREARIPRSLWFMAKLSGHGDRPQRVPMGTVDRMESDGFALNEVGVTILSPGILARMGAYRDKITGGIIGMSALGDVLLEIDFPRRTVSVHRPGREAHPPESGLPYTGISPHVTLATPSPRHPTTNVLIDTGSGGGFLLTDIESYPLRFGLIKADEYYFGIGGHWRPSFGQLDGDLRLGPYIWRDAGIGSADANTVGTAALAPWKLVIDQRRKLLWLVGTERMVTTTWPGPLEPDGRPAVYGFVGVPDGDAILIKEVDPGSRAERAGLKAGDRCRLEMPDSTKAGQLPVQLHLQLVRGSEKFKITLSLLDPPPAAPASGTAPR